MSMTEIDFMNAYFEVAKRNNNISQPYASQFYDMFSMGSWLAKLWVRLFGVINELTNSRITLSNNIFHLRNLITPKLYFSK